MPEGLQTRLKDLELSGLNGLMREYQVIYSGNFVVDGKGFSVDDAWLEQKNNAANQMLAEGVKIPCPLEHSIDPTNNAATVIGSRVGLDSKGRPSLYFSCKFDDEEKASQLKDCGVSLWAPSAEFVNAATGTKWVTPIRHLAFTRYPRIQDTDPSLALSEILVVSIDETPPTEADTMAMTPEQIKKLTDMIGFAVTDTTTEADVLDALDKFDPATLTDNNGNPPADNKGNPPAIPPLSEEIAEARGFILSSLCETGKITPAQKAVFQKTVGTMPRAEWSTLVEGLKLSSVPTMKGGSQTGPQGVETEESGNAMSRAIEKRIGK